MRAGFNTQSRPANLEQGMREGRVDAAIDWLPAAGEHFELLKGIDDAYQHFEHVHFYSREELELVAGHLGFSRIQLRPSAVQSTRRFAALKPGTSSRISISLRN